MAKTPYKPPEQSMLGQVIDSIVLLVLVVASLFLPVAMGLAGGGKIDLTFAEKSWAGMQQTPLMQSVWEKLGYTTETAAPIISSRFDYSFSLPIFLLTALVILIYFGFLIYFSDKEYREVIAERFDDK
ncbi:hypothetical protein GCM10007874_62590 [Labrys miyagiensis]|uniref:Uncharacterized protein n=1 Tax=Labrys miyagiensis TaxID=346912 RepID=A0ABQ6CU41_9HYPH|nr:hypothetical protein [Labrys miyagiensis]GLS23239.1 hypothetical protein GCM10007874_62590 [Labrys miyagiensis]